MRLGYILLVHLLLLGRAGAMEKPNVLFIIVDDLNDWVGHLGRNPQVLTPNIDRLAARGVAFSRSYSACPVCNPSRAATLSGLRASSTGVYNNQTDWRKYIPAEYTLPATFKKSGYRTISAGKVFHYGFDELTGVWDDLRPYVDDSDPHPPAGVSQGVGTIQFGPLDLGDEALQDHQLVSWTIEKLERIKRGPFFIACGIHRPHVPLNVPRRYFDRYPLDKIVLPPVLATDLDDLPAPGRYYALNFASDGAKAARPDHEMILESGRWKEAVQAYLAAISFADAQVGRLVDALDRSPHRNNTIVVLWGDNGFHLGEKLHWRKVTLWEEATHVPLIWFVPGLTPPGKVCPRTVDSMAIYPTLMELCGLQTPAHVEGVSIRSLLVNPQAKWSRPAITTARENDHTARSEQWRYIRYHDGSEELYNEDADPHEWQNVAGRSENAPIKNELASWLPKTNRTTPGRN